MSGIEAQDGQDIRQLVKAIDENTAAVRHMADACMALIAALAEVDEVDAEEGMYHLDGTRIMGIDAG